MDIATTPEEIAFFQLCSIKGAVALEVHGMKRRGQSAYSVAKEKYGLRGSKQKVFDQLQKMVEDKINERQAQQS